MKLNKNIVENLGIIIMIKILYISIILIVLFFGCVGVSHKNIDKNQMLNICHEEYSAIIKKGDDKWFPISFTVEEGGKLLPEKKYNEDKQKTLELSKKIPLVIAKAKKKEKLERSFLK